MRRITVSLDDALVEIAEAEVAAGRAPSVSAWVASAIRAKAQARAELLDDLEGLERSDPSSAQEIASLANSLGLPKAAVAKAMRRSRAGARRAG